MQNTEFLPPVHEDEGTHMRASRVHHSEGPMHTFLIDGRNDFWTASFKDRGMAVLFMSCDVNPKWTNSVQVASMVG